MLIWLGIIGTIYISHCDAAVYVYERLSAIKDERTF